MIQQIRHLIKYQLAMLGYYGAYQLTAGQTANSNNIWAIKAIGGDADVVLTAITGDDLTITISDGDFHYGKYSSVNVTVGSAGSVLVHPLDDKVTII